MSAEELKALTEHTAALREQNELQRQAMQRLPNGKVGMTLEKLQIKLPTIISIVASTWYLSAKMNQITSDIWTVRQMRVWTTRTEQSNTNWKPAGVDQVRQDFP